MNAFLLDIQRKNDINSAPSDRIYWNSWLSPTYIPRIFILSQADHQSDAFVNSKSRIETRQDCIVFNSRIMAIHSDDYTTLLRLVLEFSSSWIMAVIIRLLKNVLFFSVFRFPILKVWCNAKWIICF
jgi:hypothetical protein